LIPGVLTGKKTLRLSSKCQLHTAIRLEAETEALLKKGFRAIKMKVGLGGG